MNNIEQWFTGKARDIVHGYVIPKLIEAKALGYWPKGVSRKVKAALNKQAPAIKFARTQEKVFESIKNGGEDPSTRHAPRGWQVCHALMFGQFEKAPSVVKLIEQLTPLCKEEPQLAALRTARQWAQDFVEVAELVEDLDATRPKPEYVFKTLSPTVFRNIGLAMGIALESLEYPKVEWKKVPVTREGKTVYIWVGEIVWPPGTRHNGSKFAFGSKAGNDQCHACGHAIRNPNNWIPLIAKTKTETLSLWVGRDCATNLFGCEVSGEGTFHSRGEG